jgi:hypothetical protein
MPTQDRWHVLMRPSALYEKSKFLGSRGSMARKAET